MSDTVIKVEGVSKKYCRSIKHTMLYGVSDLSRSFLGLNQQTERLRDGEFWAVNDVSFEVKKGEVLGLIGLNGSGKSTLLKMLNGIMMPDKGRIEISGRVGALIEVGAGFHPMLTGRENIYINGAIIGMTKKEIDKKFDEIVDFAGIGEFIDSPVKHYSSGMYVRLGFAIAVHAEIDLLLLDEVLAVGDEGFQSKCFNKIGRLKKEGTSIILVSHNMHTILTFTKRVILLNKGKQKEFKNISDGVDEYRSLFYKEYDNNVQDVLSGNDRIKFYNVTIDKRILFPGDLFKISIMYNSAIDYEDVEIDTAIYCSNEHDLYFQATNKVYDKKINLLKGNHKLTIQINDIRINNATGIVVIAIWVNDRTEKLFWWRIPVKFKGIISSVGKNFLEVSYQSQEG